MQFVDPLRGFAATAVEQRELPADEEPAQLSFELNGITLAAGANFVLHGDSPSWTSLVRSCGVGWATAIAGTSARAKERRGRFPEQRATVVQLRRPGPQFGGLPSRHGSFSQKAQAKARQGGGRAP